MTEFARRVAGDAASVSGLVPLGQHGHGWQPSATIGRDVRAADAFVYVGEGFQPWADRLVTTLREEGSATTTIAAREGVDLLPPPEDGHDGGEDPETIHDGEHEEDGHEGEGEHDGDGHDAFQYLGQRYGVEIHALSGISPDANPSPADVRRAQELVGHEGITHVLAPAFESDRAARQLVEDTAAEAVLPVTSFAGLKREWVDNGWGYREVMERVNLDSLVTALGTE